MRRTGTWTQLILNQKSNKTPSLLRWWCNDHNISPADLLLLMLVTFMAPIKTRDQLTVMLKSLKLHNFYPRRIIPTKSYRHSTGCLHSLTKNLCFNSAIDSWVALKTKCRRWLLHYVLSMVLYLFMILILIKSDLLLLKQQGHVHKWNRQSVSLFVNFLVVGNYILMGHNFLMDKTFYWVKLSSGHPSIQNVCIQM